MYQQQNNTSANQKITFNGETHTIAEWTRIMGYKESKIYLRISRVWTVEEAILGRRKRK